MHRPKMQFACAAIAFVGVLAATQSADAAVGPIVNLGNIGGFGSSSDCRAVSTDGRVVVGRSGSIAYRWDAISGMTDITASVPVNQSFGNGVNGDGAVVVGEMYGPVGQRAFRWTNAGIQDLGRLPGATYSGASGVSGDGSVVVGTSGQRAFRWTSTSGMEMLGGYLNTTNSAAIAANTDGSVIVGFDYLNGADIQAFRWSSSGGVQYLGGVGSDTKSRANAVNGSGSAVVGWSGTSSVMRASLWTAGTGMVSLGVLGSDLNSEALGVSADGLSVVGWSGGTYQGDVDNKPFLWTPGLGMVNLNTYLPAIGVNLAGWTLTNVSGISGDGNTIVGNGVINGQSRPWLVTIPAPSAAGVITAAGILAVRRRRPAR